MFGTTHVKSQLRYRACDWLRTMQPLEFPELNPDRSGAKACALSAVAQALQRFALVLPNHKYLRKTLTSNKAPCAKILIIMY